MRNQSHWRRCIAFCCELCLIGALALSLTGCPKKSPAERAGDAVGDAADSVGDAARDAGDAIDDAVH